MMDEDVARLKQILDACPAVPAICLDVANGYSEHFVEFVKNVRSKFPEHIIMVCNKLNFGCLIFCCNHVNSLIPHLTVVCNENIKIIALTEL